MEGRRGGLRFRRRIPLLALALIVLPGVAFPEEPVRVVVRGVDDELLENVQAALALPPGLVRDGVVDLPWLDRYLEQAPERARAALQPFGYYRSVVEVRTTPLGGGRYRVDVEVRAGPPVAVDNVSVRLAGEGALDERLRAEVERFPLKPGDVLRQDVYEEARNALLARARERGYLDADYAVRELRIHVGSNRGAIDLLLDTGRRFRFGPVTIVGAPSYPEKFLRRYLAFREGDPYSGDRIAMTQVNYLDSDRFRDATVVPERERAAGAEVPVTVRLTPTKPKRFRVGAGYGTDTGPRATTGYRDVNLFRRGYEFAANVDVAQRKQTAGAEVLFPSSRNLLAQTALRLGLDRERVSTYSSRSGFAELERVYALGRGRLGSLYLRLLREISDVGASTLRSRMVLPGVRYSLRTYGNPVRPVEGHRLGVEVRGTHQAIGSTTGMLQLIGNGNQVVALPARFFLYLRGQAGVTFQNEPVRDIPASLRFFAGGDQSVRGYAYRSLGPVNALGEVEGGKHLLTAGVEVERGLGENWGVAMFYDAGNAFNSLSGNRWPQGAGIGVRRYTTVGPVRVDVARQVGVGDPAFRLHVGVGFGW